MQSEPLQDALGYEDTASALPRGKAQSQPATARWEVILLSLWFAANLLVGVLTVHQYGVSFDEPNNYRYAADTLTAYQTFFGLLGKIPYNTSYDGHGPAFMAAMLLVIRGIQDIIPGAFQPDLFHFSYFVAFQLTGLCLYLLMRRWFHAWTAWGVLVLFDTQPLLLGHAFINPKDIPFMLFFTASVLLGFRLADRAGLDEPFLSLRGPVDALLRTAQPRRGKTFFVLLGAAAIAALALAVFSGPVEAWLGQTAKFFYRAAPDSWAGRVFSLFAAQASRMAVKDFIAKVQQVFQQAERFVLLAGLLLFAVYFGATFPAAVRAGWEWLCTLPQRAADAARRTGRINRGSWKAVLAAVWENLRQPRVLTAGVVLGVAASVRAVAPWAGGIAFLYLLMRARSKAWAAGAAYFLVAAIVTYLTWPRLWGAPFQRYWGGLHTISNFVAAQHVLFNGRVYAATALPGSYLVTLLNIQLTEPFLLCAYIGIVLLGWRLLRGRVRADLLLYVLLAFAAPVVGWMVMRSPLYDNLRQVLFLFPAMFALAAFTLEWVFQKLRRNWLRAMLIVAIALPGMYASVTLYPYEYNYYNSLVGGAAEARKLYTMDPWRTSLREIALALNQRAPSGAKVLAGDWAEIMRLYTRPDIILEASYSDAADANGEYDYAVQVPNVKPWDLRHATQDAFVVSRGGAVLGKLIAVDNATAK